MKTLNNAAKQQKIDMNITIRKVEEAAYYNPIHTENNLSKYYEIMQEGTKFQKSPCYGTVENP